MWAGLVKHWYEVINCIKPTILNCASVNFSMRTIRLSLCHFGLTFSDKQNVLEVILDHEKWGGSCFIFFCTFRIIARFFGRSSQLYGDYCIQISLHSFEIKDCWQWSSFRFFYYVTCKMLYMINLEILSREYL